MIHIPHNEKKPIDEMRRHELIFALASHVHSSVYHSILDWPTDGLRMLLLSYTSKEPQNTGRKILYPVAFQVKHA